MRVRELMQEDVRTVDASARLDVVERLMRDEVIRHVPVLDEGELVGVVTQRDLLRAGLSPTLSASPAVEQEWLAEIPVRNVMTRHVVTAHPDADLADAITMMVHERIGCLPVVDGARVIGMLSDTDCLRHLARLLRSGIDD